MREYTAVEVEGIARNELRSDLEKLLREGARQMLEVALQTEVAEYTERHQGERDARGRRLVVRNGFHSATPTGHRRQSTGAAATGRRPARGSGVHQRYSTPDARRAPSIDVLVPALYLQRHFHLELSRGAQGHSGGTRCPVFHRPTSCGSSRSGKRSMPPGGSGI